MSAANGQSVLWCPQCRKPFNNESTLKRHGYYCRSRKGGRPTRARSCKSCARGKVGCDNQRPQCSRCTTMGIVCEYPTSTPRAVATRHSHDASAESRTTTPPFQRETHAVENLPNADNGMILDDDSALVLSSPHFANLGGDHVEEDSANIELVDFMNLQMNGSYLSPSSPFFLNQSTPSTDQTIRLRQGLSPPNFSIPPAPVAVRSLIHRPRLQPGGQRVSNLILHTLKSYPLMMFRHNTLPPFIHPSLISSDTKNTDMEFLINCISLMRMISGSGSRKLFWRNVRQECERTSEDYLKFNEWELLAAMQALSIYVLTRLDEGETENNDFDFLLVKAVIVVAQQLSRNDITCHTQCALCNNGLETSWKEWIYRESRRRLAVVYRVVNRLVYFEPAAMCDMPAEFMLAPLPAKRQLWEAGDEFTWKAESQKEPGVQFGLAANGEIVKLEDGRLSCSDAWLPYESPDSMTQSMRTANWEDWCSGIDGFGGLVMLLSDVIWTLPFFLKWTLLFDTAANNCHLLIRPGNNTPYHTTGITPSTVNCLY
ncbi:hypothetical protein GGR54DRAFT_613228 [Hypoxylon sp. NC1633]|nr:hypothetical protein GGR54DRAFT_613228 [Hypoxylon sp. NC1633]